jgi:hypothetical protein
VKLLIEKNKLGLTQDNYSKLKENFDGFHINLIEVRRKELDSIIAELDFDDSDIIALLRSSALLLKDKEDVINNYPDVDLAANIEILGLIGGILLDNGSFEVNQNIKKAILIKSEMNTDDKIKLFNNIHSTLEITDITNILQSLPEPYSNILLLQAKNEKRPILSENERNTNFAQILKDKKYIRDFKHEERGIKISTFRN